MADFDLKNADPRAVARVAEYINGRSFDGPGTAVPPTPFPQRGPVPSPAVKSTALAQPAGAQTRLFFPKAHGQRSTHRRSSRVILTSTPLYRPRNISSARNWPGASTALASATTASVMRIR